MGTADCLIHQLCEFIATLPKPRFDAGPREQLAVRDLLLRLIETHSFPKHRGDLKTLLAPLVCSTPEAQDEFYALFDRWLNEQSSSSQTGIATAAVRAARSHRWLLAAAALVALIGITSWRLRVLWEPLPYPPLPAPISAPLPEDPLPQPGQFAGTVTAQRLPLSGAKIWLPSSNAAVPLAETDSQGRFSIAIPQLGSNLLVTHLDYQPAYLGLTSRIDLKPAANTVLQHIEQPPARRFPAWVGFAIAVLIAGAFLAWQLWRMAARRAVLRQWETWADLKPLKVETGSSEQELFQDARVAQLARELQRRVPRTTNRIAVVPTIKATVARAGVLSPVKEERRTVREYLALVERSNSRDQQARLWSALLKRLASRSVYIDLYYYSGDARLCEAPGRERAWIGVEELAALHPHHELWLFADPSRLFDPFSGDPAPWLAPLVHWQERTVFADANADAGLRELLEPLGFRVRPPTLAGLLGGEAELGASYPRLLEEDEKRWLAWQPSGARSVLASNRRASAGTSPGDNLGDPKRLPGEQELRKLDRQLQAWLGAAGYRCLAACAVYPGLAWNLTLHLTLHLAGRQAPEEILTRLARLVWFRHGRMPVWLREHLVGTLDRASARQIRRLLQQFVEAARQRPQAGESLEFVRRTDQGGSNQPIRDYVFLSFLEGRKPKPYEVQAPGWLARLLYPEGRREMGVRRAVLLTLAVLLGALVYWSADWASQWKAPAKPAAWRMVQPPPAPLPPIQAASPALSRAVEIAESQIGAPPPKSESVSSWALHQMAFSATFATVQHHLSATPPAGIRPGWIFVRHDRSDGMVDFIFNDSVILLESVSGVVQRTLWAFRDLDGSFLNPALELNKPPWVNPKDGLTYIWIKPGKFQMGCSPDDQQCSPNERPTHDVEITQGFWLGQTEVTQTAYSKVMKQNPSDFKGDLRPVEQVTWTEAKNYCQAVGLGLPTEAQWEYATRAGSTATTYGELDQIAWYSKNSGSSTHDVKGKLPNAWGLYDMLGNVWEWVADWYDDSYYGKSPARDPSGPSTGTVRVLRGGSWLDNPQFVRASNRDRNGPEYRGVDIGFRCAGESP